MTRATSMLALAAALAAGAAGYRAGRDGVPQYTLISPALGGAMKPSKADNRILYYQDPDGKSDYSDVPKKTPDGRDFIAVLASEDGNHAVWLNAALDDCPDAGTHSSGGTAAPDPHGRGRTPSGT